MHSRPGSADPLTVWDVTRAAAFFDLDKTVIAKSSTLAFGRPFFNGGLINRRAVLKDPLLPADLLPEDWPGAAARDLCATIYRTVAPAAEAWLDANATTDTGPLPPAGAAFAAG